MKNRKYIFILLVSGLVAFFATLVALVSITNAEKKLQTLPVTIRSVGQTISATGTIHSQNEATLHFQTGGKLVYLPVKEGDSVFAGQTIAQLDTYALQRQLTQALNNYRSTRDTFDQTQDNAQNGVAVGSQRYGLEVTSKSGLTPGDIENNIINNIVQRIGDQNQVTLDNSVINVELANYAVQLASIQAPFSGVVTHEDVTVANQNVTTTTAFSVADPSALVFRADVSANDIDYVTEGSLATIQLVGWQHPLSGTVVKIYPQKLTLSTGEDVYEVDVQANNFQNSKLGQTGIVNIVGSNTQPTVLVPSWTIVGHSYVWVMEHNQPVLKHVSIGATHQDTTEVYAGLEDGESIITNPQAVAAQKYFAL